MNPSRPAAASVAAPACQCILGAGSDSDRLLHLVSSSSLSNRPNFRSPWSKQRCVLMHSFPLHKIFSSSNFTSQDCLPENLPSKFARKLCSSSSIRYKRTFKGESGLLRGVGSTSPDWLRSAVRSSRPPSPSTCLKCEQNFSEHSTHDENGGTISKALLEERNINDVASSIAQRLRPERRLYPPSNGIKEGGYASSPSRPIQEVRRTETSNTFPTCEKPPKEHVESAVEREAWDLLKSAVVSYCGNPVGTIAANDPTDASPLNYDQVFIRDFIPSAIAFLLKGEHDIVRNFLLNTLQLQSWEKTVDCYDPGRGLMPASFKVRTVPLDGDEANGTEEILDPDFGEAAIGRVAPVDSGLWWIILLRAYGKCTGDLFLQERVDVQTGMKMMLKLWLADGFDMFPTLLVTDGSCMIDRRMGIHGHPLEIQSLFYSALRSAREMLLPEDGAQEMIRLINSRLSALSFHIQEYFWIDLRKLNEIYRYKTEEYSYDAVNKFNIYPEQVSPWLVEWMPDNGGYFIGNLQPAHMDFRFFSLGNLWAICCSLATKEQAEGILDLVEAKWDDLVGNMPFKISYPSLEEDEWRIITGRDPKNTCWSYHNGGSWPTLLWQFTVACIKMGRPELARKAVEVAEKRLSRDRWPEYYDTRTGRFIGKQARLYQTWSIAGFLVAKLLLANPKAASFLTCEEDIGLLDACILDANPRRKRKYSTSDTMV